MTIGNNENLDRKKDPSINPTFIEEEYSMIQPMNPSYIPVVTGYAVEPPSAIAPPVFIPTTTATAIEPAATARPFVPSSTPPYVPSAPPDTGIYYNVHQQPPIQHNSSIVGGVPGYTTTTTASNTVSMKPTNTIPGGAYPINTCPTSGSTGTCTTIVAHTNNSQQQQQMMLSNNMGGLGRQSVRMHCPYCNVEVYTKTWHRSNMFTLLIAIVLFLIFLPLAIIPFLIPGCKAVDHLCPNCKRCIGRTSPCD